MNSRKGKLIVIDGGDGSGKATQTVKLSEALRLKGFTVKTFNFPRYDKTFFGKEVANYLNGEFGDMADINPKLISLLYAGDRLETKRELETALLTHDFVICDRYVESNLGYTLARFDTKKEQDDFHDWVIELEHKVYGLPQSDRVIYLRVPSTARLTMVDAKGERTYTDKGRDLHEADVKYQEKVDQSYIDLYTKYCEKWVLVSCWNHTEDSMKSIEMVHNDIMELNKDLFSH